MVVPQLSDGLVVAVAVGGLALLAIMVLLVGATLRRGRRVPAAASAFDLGDLGAALAPLEVRLARLEARLSGVEDRTARLEAASQVAVSRVGLVRFNPFEDTGGNQSFALALLDAGGDGIVVSSLHARSGTRIYAKAIRAGQAAAALSDEEAEAVRQALGDRGS